LLVSIRLCLVLDLNCFHPYLTVKQATCLDFQVLTDLLVHYHVLLFQPRGGIYA